MKKKHNRNFLQSLTKDFIKGFSRIYWFVYTYIKYHYYTKKFILSKKIISDFGISILIPTKNRSKKFENMLKSLVDNKSNFFKVEVLVLFDEDENELDLYKTVINKYISSVEIFYFNKNFEKNSERINFLATKSKYDIILLINDDLNFCLKNWNKIICHEFSKINMDKPFSLWLRTDDVKYKYFHSNFPVINRAWHNVLNYHSPSKYFNHWWSDNWICDLGKKSGKFLITNQVFFTHFNKFQKNQLDSLYVENERKRDGEKDYQNWIKLDNVRKEDAKKLL